MVLLAITPAGLADAMRLASEAKASVWCGADAVSDEEYKARSWPGLSRFIYPLQGASAETLARAIDTIEQHHSGETVWVEARSEA